ncbi:hypothetical protein [Rhodococcus sp. MEB041]|uniref:hypothetical protein n=1 Tax=Rhodococcus sp. MEB041 TaxID=3040323 RepID=UPI00254C5240|nr:hypothetical protein [Rhodococcus sp. MEB041]
MATAALVQESMSWWAPGTNLYALSEPFNGHDHIAITKVPTGTSVIPATETGASVADPNGFGLMAHRTWYPPIEHSQALAELGYEVQGV